MKKYKLGIFIPNINSNWNGGINYFSNLLYALENIEDNRFEIVIFAEEKLKEKYKKRFKSFTYISTNKFNLNNFLLLVSTLIYKLTKNPLLLRFYLIYKKISVTAYGPPLGKNNKIKSICWIPDFQDKKFPEYFSKKERFKRNKVFNSITKNADIILLSSKNAQNDFLLFDTNYQYKIRILRFVVSFPKNKFLSEKKIKEKYNLPKYFFYLPNQYWIHKNHFLVAKALIEIKKRNKKIYIVSSGKNYDYRNPNYFKEFYIFLRENQLLDQYRILGNIPHEDVLSLNKASIAIINPSLFEGWSTTVEEAKFFKTSMILSDIAVHREQADNKADFFPLNSHEKLADILETKFKNRKYKVSNKDYFFDENHQRDFENYAKNFFDIAYSLLK